ncbi:MAG: ABC transporter ATP-binding protein [Tenericutes bacterium]|jgi:multidrug/hemolysin transport system ATP-binding protein|nr:ABC transporter ATP-binding protein [Mycoplasmatota bacterium]
MIKAIQVKNLVKSYGDLTAVKNISFDVEKDSFFAFLGPNGAGKTTTIKIISTLLEKNEGDIKIFGLKLDKDNQQIRKEIGVVFQNNMLDDLLTVRENLLIRASFYGYNKDRFEERLLEINDYIHFNDFLDQRYSNLSGGQRRKADIARALLHWPSLLILDEPTTGLDPKSRKDIWNLINKLRDEKNMTIFLTTHYMEEVKDANKVVIIDQGEIIATGSSEDLRLKYSNDRLKMIPKNSLFEVLDKNNQAYEIINGLAVIILENCFNGIDLVNKYKNHIKDFEIIRGDMDDVFVNITGRKLGGSNE